MLGFRSAWSYAVQHHPGGQVRGRLASAIAAACLLVGFTVLVLGGSVAMAAATVVVSLLVAAVVNAVPFAWNMLRASDRLAIDAGAVKIANQQTEIAALGGTIGEMYGELQEASTRARPNEVRRRLNGLIGEGERHHRVFHHTIPVRSADVRADEERLAAWIDQTRAYVDAEAPRHYQALRAAIAAPDLSNYGPMLVRGGDDDQGDWFDQSTDLRAQERIERIIAVLRTAVESD